MHDLEKYQQEIQDTRQEVRNLTVMAMSPDLHPRDLELVKALERMARVEVELRLKHLKWAREQNEIELRLVRRRWAGAGHR